jgi:hypothetical protein
MFKTIWEGNFSNKSDIAREFQIEEQSLKNDKILIASYATGNYEGSSFVLFERAGKLYEVNAGHCSCYGLEGQWSEEETSVESLQHRLEKGNLAYHAPVWAVEQFLKEYKLTEGGEDMYALIEEGTTVAYVKDISAKGVEHWMANHNAGRDCAKLEAQLFDSIEDYCAHKESAEQANLRKQALSKLSIAEREALGLEAE